jgi:hypothetical protein
VPCRRCWWQRRGNRPCRRAWPRSIASWCCNAGFWRLRTGSARRTLRWRRGVRELPALGLGLRDQIGLRQTNSHIAGTRLDDGGAWQPNSLKLVQEIVRLLDGDWAGRIVGEV